MGVGGFESIFIFLFDFRIICISCNCVFTTFKPTCTFSIFLEKTKVHTCTYYELFIYMSIHNTILEAKRFLSVYIWLWNNTIAYFSFGFAVFSLFIILFSFSQLLGDLQSLNLRSKDDDRDDGKDESSQAFSKGVIVDRYIFPHLYFGSWMLRSC